MKEKCIVLFLMAFISGLAAPIVQMRIIIPILLLFGFFSVMPEKSSNEEDGIIRRSEQATQAFSSGCGFFFGVLATHLLFNRFHGIWWPKFFFVSTAFFIGTGMTYLIYDCHKNPEEKNHKNKDPKKRMFESGALFLSGTIVSFFVSIVFPPALWVVALIVGFLFPMTVKTRGISNFFAVSITTAGIFLGNLILYASLENVLNSFIINLIPTVIAPVLFLCGIGLSILWDLARDPLSEIVIWE